MERRRTLRGAFPFALLLTLVSCTGSSHHASHAPTLSASPSSSAQPTISPSPEPFICDAGGQLSSVHMVSAGVGWAIMQAPPGCDGNLRAILRTSNGGRTWRNVTPPAAVGSGYSAAFVGADHAWTVAAPKPGASSARVLRTDDGGNIWHAAGAIHQYGVCCSAGIISFVDERDGWISEDLGAAAGSEGVAVLRSNDGGSRWTLATLANVDTETSTGLTFGCDKGISVSGASTAWAAGTCGDRPLFLVSRNGGRSWANVDLPGITAATAASVEPPIFASPAVGILLVSTFVGSPNSTKYVDLLFATNDAGRVWRKVVLPRSAGIISPDVLDASHWWLIRAEAKPRIFITDDGGRLWQSVTPSIPLAGTQVLLLGSRRAIDVPLDRNGPMMETVDGGKTWHTYSLVIK